MWHVWGRRDKHAGFLWGKPERKRSLGRLGVDVRIILK
jgi:hypothetical protein